MKIIDVEMNPVRILALELHIHFVIKDCQVAQQMEQIALKCNHAQHTLLRLLA